MISISAFKAGLWEGSLIAPRTLVYLPSAKKKARFETQFAIKDARLQSIINSFGGAQKEPGIVQCDWQGGGEFDLASLAGSGALSIGEADFGRVPIVGPLHFVFNILAPRFHTDEPSTMTVNHRMAGSLLHLEDLKLVSEHAHVQSGRQHRSRTRIRRSSTREGDCGNSRGLSRSCSPRCWNSKAKARWITCAGASRVSQAFTRSSTLRRKPPGQRTQRRKKPTGR